MMIMAFVVFGLSSVISAVRNIIAGNLDTTTWFRPFQVEYVIFREDCITISFKKALFSSLISLKSSIRSSYDSGVFYLGTDILQHELLLYDDPNDIVNIFHELPCFDRNRVQSFQNDLHRCE